MMGQTAVDTAHAFHDQVNFDGVLLTKMDGDTRSGAVPIRKVTGKSVKMISTEEKPMDLVPFHPDRMAKRILSIGSAFYRRKSQAGMA